MATALRPGPSCAPGNGPSWTCIRPDGRWHEGLASMAARKKGINQQDKEHLEHLVRERTEDLERANERLLLANQVKGEFLAHMSKELRTPLNYIIDLAALMLDEAMGDLNHEQRACLDSIAESSSRLRSIVDKILELCNIDIGMTRFLPKRLPAAERLTKL